MTSRAQRVFQEAMELSEPERMDLAEQLVASVPPDSEWMDELERRAQRAFEEPDGGVPWEVARERLAARVQRR
jgi:putative addiction module component (TIGR02574 family)